MKPPNLQEEMEKYNFFEMHGSKGRPKGLVKYLICLNPVLWRRFVRFWGLNSFKWVES
jgi:hypothetical protein